MTNHPITPPPELVQQWVAELWQEGTPKFELHLATHIATRSAQWGADQELEACCEWVEKTIPSWAPNTLNEQLRAARRPKPPSLKEQALAALDDAIMRGDCITISDALPILRRALEALPD